MFLKKSSNASSPPAEAPTPTIGKSEKASLLIIDSFSKLD